MLRKGLIAGLLAAVTWLPAMSYAAAPACVLAAGTRPDLACAVHANGLPNVLYIGDSVSINTMPQLTQELRATANLCHIYSNDGTTGHGVDCLHEWLSDTAPGVRWDYVLVNFGLHDIKRRLSGAPATTQSEYRRNLRVIVDGIRRYGASPIWVTTTPFPASLLGTKFSDPAPYAAISANEMRALSVPIIDTYDLILPNNATGHRPNDVHWSGAATEILSNAIAGALTGEILSGGN